jgi:hypothetical protein
MKDKFKIDDTVYIPDEDPKADTIYTIEALSRDYARLYHPMKPSKVLPLSEVKESPL